MDVKDAPVMSAMRKLSGQYPRYGYRRALIFLERDGLTMSADRCERIWRKAGLQVPRKRPRRRISGRRERPNPPESRNHVWAYDFVFDACANSQMLKCFCVVDEFTRECLAIEVAGSIRGNRVIEVLSKLISVHGAPQYLRCDNVLSPESSRSSAQPFPRAWVCPKMQPVPQQHFEPATRGLPRSGSPSI